MTERIALASLSILTALSFWLAPWAALARQTGARSSVVLLPQRFIDFTGRTEALSITGLGAVLLISLLAVALVFAASFLKRQARTLLWLVAGSLLIFTTAWGLNNVQESVRNARLGLIEELITEELADPRERTDVEALTQVLERSNDRAIAITILESRQAGYTIKRVPYDGSGMGLAAFLAYVTGFLAILFGLRFFERLNAGLNRVLRLSAVPAVSILLSLIVAAFVILRLQETGLGNNIVITDPFMYLAGRLEILWRAYLTLFAGSLSTLSGFAESLKFSTPLIFTGLAVAFGFQAGLFNIGAPGQMVLGAVFATLVGLYMPGPRLVVIPAVIMAAALGGGIWGAIPGWLKARFGANEVINTILMNYIAASILLFILSSSLSFAAPALRMLQFLGILAVVLVILSLVPAIKALLAKSPRMVWAIVGVVALGGMIATGLPREADQVISFSMPFKAPGSEPKSYELLETARLTQLPELLGVEQKGEVVVQLNIAALLAFVAFLLGLWGLPKTFARFKNRWQNLTGAVVLAGLVFGVAALFGLLSVDTLLSPTKLNTSFIIAIIAAVFMQYFLWRTKWGYELRAVGVSPKAAEYGGASIAKNTILTMTISGALAGLTACHYVLGGALEDFSLRQALPTNDGFDGIAVALLGGNTPIGVVLAAFLFGVLKNGGTSLSINFPGLTKDVVSMILALVVLFIAARGFLPEAITNPLKRVVMPNDASKDEADKTVTKDLTGEAS